MQELQNFIQLLLKDASVQWEASLTVRRNEHLTVPGQISNQLYWIESGALRAYFLTEEREQTLRLGYPNSMIADLPSLLTGKPSEVHIQAIKKTTVRPLSHKALEAFIYSNEHHMKLYITMMEEFMVQQIDRELDILTTSPLERYHRCLKRSPQLFQHIPARHIAAYLNMSEETLSRLKKNTLKQNT